MKISGDDRPTAFRWATANSGFRLDDRPFVADGRLLRRKGRVVGIDGSAWEVEDGPGVETSVGPWLVLERQGEAWGGSPDPDYAEEYEPLQDPNLHRTFAALSGGPKAILAFAEKHGFLGRKTHCLRWDVGTQQGWDENMVWGERLDDWRRAIRRLRFLLAIKDAIAKENWSQTGSPPIERLAGKIPAIGGDPDPDPEIRDALNVGLSLRMYSLTERSLQRSQGIRAEAGSVLERFLNEELEAGSYGMVEAKRRGQVRLVPRDLLGALYVLLAWEVIGASPRPRACKKVGCGRQYVPSHGRQIYCSDSCKWKAFRAGESNKRTKEETKEGEEDGD